MKSILLLGDAHLRERDPEVTIFLDFLSQLSSETEALYLLGDLFDLWIGSPAFLTDCHRRIAAQLGTLRKQGTEVIYVEGNRDYHLKALYDGTVFGNVAEEGFDLSYGARRIHLAHGDLVNRADRPYRLWRRLAKGPLLMGAFQLLPAGLARGLADRMERRIARTNRRHRVRFPEEECRRFALEKLQSGVDTLVLGHFHQEARFLWEEGSRRIEVFVLPSFREAGRFLRLDAQGGARFESFPAVRGGE
jgi:UDP-2,3-diacylglucosamine hydrolase